MLGFVDRVGVPNQDITETNESEVDQFLQNIDSDISILRDSFSYELEEHLYEEIHHFMEGNSLSDSQIEKMTQRLEEIDDIGNNHYHDELDDYMEQRDSHGNLLMVEDFVDYMVSQKGWVTEDQQYQIDFFDQTIMIFEAGNDWDHVMGEWMFDQNWQMLLLYYEGEVFLEYEVLVTESGELHLKEIGVQHGDLIPAY